jgi:hypothetical protein
LHILTDNAFVQIFKFGNIENSDEVHQCAGHFSFQDVQCSFDVVAVGRGTVTVLQTDGIVISSLNINDDHREQQRTVSLQ